MLCEEVQAFPLLLQEVHSHSTECQQTLKLKKNNNNPTVWPHRGKKADSAWMAQAETAQAALGDLG